MKITAHLLTIAVCLTAIALAPARRVAASPPGSAPVIQKLTPPAGRVGNAVTIRGKHFGASQGDGRVTFNGTTASVDSWSDTQIVVRVPEGAKSGPVVVTVAGVDSKGVYFRVKPPRGDGLLESGAALTGVSPGSGCNPTTLTLTGTNMVTGSGTVRFRVGSTTKTATGNFSSPSTCTVTVPAGLPHNGTCTIDAPNNALGTVSFTSCP